MIASLTPLADALLRASLDGLLFCGIAFGLSRLLQRLPLACVWLWRLALLKFMLGLLGVGVALGPVPGASGTSSASASSSPWLYCILGGLAVGALLGAERLVRELRFLYKLHKDSQPAPEEWERAMPASRFVRLRTSATIPSPLATGVFRPTIYLPTDLELSAADRERVLAHELAHIRHGDLWFGWLVFLLETVFFFHPGFWLARRELRLAQEMAADRAVSGAYSEYARLLLSLSCAKPGATTALGISEGFQTLQKRLETLSTPRRPADALWLTIAAIFALGLGTLTMAPRRAPAASVRTRTPAAAAAVFAPAAMAEPVVIR